jgi:ubiquinone/menaquinone biosynthesis C-methylase UbiE
MENKKEAIQRVSRTKEEAISTYDKMSKHYDTISGSSENKFKKKGVALLAVQEGERVLEIGFGTGFVLEILARAVGSSGKVHGIDLSAGMLSFAEKRLKKAGLLDNVDLKLGDAATLPFDDMHFDAIFMSFTLDLIDTPEIPVVLGSCARVLKDGGRICVVALSLGDGKSKMVGMYNWFHEKFPKQIDCRPILAKNALETAGFSIVTHDRGSMWRLPVDIVLARKGI